MIQYKFAEYPQSSLYYRCFEEEVRSKMGTDLVLLAEQVSFNPKKARMAKSVV
jgi:hypothetical protein